MDPRLQQDISSLSASQQLAVLASALATGHDVTKTAAWRSLSSGQRSAVLSLLDAADAPPPAPGTASIVTASPYQLPVFMDAPSPSELPRAKPIREPDDAADDDDDDVSASDTPAAMKAIVQATMVAAGDVDKPVSETIDLVETDVLTWLRGLVVQVRMRSPSATFDVDSIAAVAGPDIVQDFQRWKRFKAAAPRNNDEDKQEDPADDASSTHDSDVEASLDVAGYSTTMQNRLQFAAARTADMDSGTYKQFTTFRETGFASSKPVRRHICQHLVPGTVIPGTRMKLLSFLMHSRIYDIIEYVLNSRYNRLQAADSPVTVDEVRRAIDELPQYWPLKLRLTLVGEAAYELRS